MAWAPRYSPARVGAGRIDVPAASLGQVIAMNLDDSSLVSVAFPPEVSGVVTRTKKIRLVNKGTTPQTYDVAIDTVVDAPGLSFSLPGGSSVTVPAASSVELAIQMDGNSALMKKSRDPAVYPTQGVQASYGDQPRNFMSEEAAYVTFSQAANLKFRLPVYMAEKPNSDMSQPATIATMGNPTGSTSIPLSGNDLCTGMIAAGPTCTGSFPTDVESLVSPYELHVVSPRDPANAPDFADIKYVGAAFLPGAGSPSLANDVIMFGVASWGDWSTPNEVAYNICIDTNNDGLYDRAIINTHPGIFVGGASPNDNNVRVVQNLSTPPFGFSILGLGSPVNLVGPNVVDTSLQINNTMILGVTPQQLGFTNPALQTLRYKVVTCPGFNPACARGTGGGDRCSPIAGTYYDIAPGPYIYNWAPASQGLNFGGNFLAEDLNTNSLPVTWNTANMAANGSPGALLLHHHNAAGKRAQVAVLEGAPATDLGVTITADSATPPVGGNVVYTVVVTNNGPSDATGVQVAVELPAGLNYVSDDGGGAYSSGSGVWSVGALMNTASATLKITATVVISEQINVVAEVGASTPLNINAVNDRATASIRAPRTADLQITSAGPMGATLVGQPVTYTLTVKNLGGDPAYGISVQETFPGFPTLTPTSSMASQGLFTPATGIWNLGGLGVGMSATLSFTVTAPNMAGTLTNNASVTTNAAVNPGDAVDTNPVNNSSTAGANILSPAMITATKTVVGTMAVGGTVTYTVVLTNSGMFDQQNNMGSEFVDVLPAGLTLVGATATSGTAVATTMTNTVTWDGVVPAAGTVTITITATINSVPAGTIVSNQGQANYDADGNGTNEAFSPTDDPSVGGSADPTKFTVVERQLTVAKKWVDGKTGDTASVVTAGFTSNATSGASVSTGNNTTTGMPVVMTPGQTGTISESLSVGDGANYNAVLACTGNTNPLSGNSLTIAVTDINIVCTITNTRKQATLTLKKTWVIGKPGDTATVSSSGFTNNATSGASVSTGNNTTTGASVTVFAGESGTISEAFTVGSASNYRVTLTCTGNATPLSGNTLTINPADTAITCTMTNGPKATLTVRKQWVNAISGNIATVSTSGFSNNTTTGASTSSGNNSTTSASVQVAAGETGTISETFSMGSASDYNATLACSGNTTPLNGNALTVHANDTSILCTLTNKRKSATLLLKKTWVNGKPGDRVMVTSSGFSNNASSGESVAAGNNTTTGEDVAVVYPGESGTIGETYLSGAATNYTTTLSCSGNAAQLAGNTLSVSATDTMIVCTLTNSRKAATLTVAKKWVNGVAGDVATVSTTGFTNVASSGASTSAGNNTTTGMPVAVYAGDVGTIKETFSNGNANIYASSLACTGNGNAIGANDSLVISSTDTVVLCTWTNATKPMVSGTKTVSGSLAPGTKVTYTVILSNAGPGPQADNAGPEFSDVLPGALTLLSATATSGTATANLGMNQVTWDGSIAVGASVTITIVARIPPATALGTVISNQGTLYFDADQNGSNESTTVTDDPGAAGSGNPTVFTVRGTLDVDYSETLTKYDALTDGLLSLRYLFNFNGAVLVGDALGKTAQRTDPVEIRAYLDSMRMLLDVDGDGTPDALTDGVMIVRYLFGFRGDDLIKDTVSKTATRKTAPLIEAWIQALMP